MKRSQPHKPVTILDVARAAGVTKSTVSLALSGKGTIADATRQSVWKVARRLQYEPNVTAQRLSHGGSHNTIALFSTHLDFSVGSSKLQLIQGLLARKGYDVPAYAYGICLDRFSGSSTDHARILSDLRRQRPRAIVCNSNTLGDDARHELQRYQDAGGIVVSYDFDNDMPCDKVIFDRADNTYRGAKHLLELGHRKIAYWTPGVPRPQGERLAGFLRALEEYGVKLNPDWLIGEQDYRGHLGWAVNALLAKLLLGGEDAPAADDSAGETGGAELVRQFLSIKDRPTALCVNDDYSAVAFASALEDAGLRVPRDLSIVGADDASIARHGFLKLTTTSNPIELIARATVELLCSRLDSSYAGEPRQVIVQGELIVRNSTRAISA